MSSLHIHSMISSFFLRRTCVTVHGYIPVTYLFMQNNQMVPVEAQKMLVEFARSESAVADVVTTGSDHWPVLSILEKTVGVLVAAARGWVGGGSFHVLGGF
ncbi:hypothetical protein WAI453_010483 [Rhynchosporium graminicola]